MHGLPPKSLTSFFCQKNSTKDTIEPTNGPSTSRGITSSYLVLWAATCLLYKVEISANIPKIYHYHWFTSLTVYGTQSGLVDS